MLLDCYQNKLPCMLTILAKFLKNISQWNPFLSPSWDMGSCLCWLCSQLF